jgi:hypothetical protein
LAAPGSLRKGPSGRLLRHRPAAGQASKRDVTVTAARTLSAFDEGFGAGTFAGGWGERRPSRRAPPRSHADQLAD